MPQTIQIFGTADDSIVDGPGIRFAVFTQGCSHGCPGCHNPESHPFEGGKAYTVDGLIDKLSGNPLLAGVTLSGGEPFEQAGPLVEFCKRIHTMTGMRGEPLNIWAYSGYTFEELIAGTPTPEAKELLEQCDVLVDGPFIESQKSYDLHFKGSANQRLIDVPKSLAAGKAVLWEEEG
jgi:anaerobic ribonucleoside-triphosphate reductase activating protein